MPQACWISQDPTSHLVTQAAAEQKTKCSVQPVFLSIYWVQPFMIQLNPFFARLATMNSINTGKQVCSIPKGFSNLNKKKKCKLQLIWHITNEFREDCDRTKMIKWLMLANCLEFGKISSIIYTRQNQNIKIFLNWDSLD